MLLACDHPSHIPKRIRYKPDPRVAHIIVILVDDLLLDGSPIPPHFRPQNWALNDTFDDNPRALATRYSSASAATILSHRRNYTASGHARLLSATLSHPPAGPAYLPAPLSLPYAYDTVEPLCTPGNPFDARHSGHTTLNSEDLPALLIANFYSLLLRENLGLPLFLSPPTTGRPPSSLDVSPLSGHLRPAPLSLLGPPPTAHSLSGLFPPSDHLTQDFSTTSAECPLQSGLLPALGPLYPSLGSGSIWAQNSDPSGWSSSLPPPFSSSTPATTISVTSRPTSPPLPRRRCLSKFFLPDDYQPPRLISPPTSPRSAASNNGSPPGFPGPPRYVSQQPLPMLDCTLPPSSHQTLPTAGRMKPPQTAPRRSPRLKNIYLPKPTSLPSTSSSSRSRKEHRSVPILPPQKLTVAQARERLAASGVPLTEDLLTRLNDLDIASA